MIEIYQRGERDWAVYSDGEYAGTVSRVGEWFVCTHTRDHFLAREVAISFLVEREEDIRSLERSLAFTREEAASVVDQVEADATVYC